MDIDLIREQASKITKERRMKVITDMPEVAKSQYALNTDCDL